MQKIRGNQSSNSTEIGIGDFRGDPDEPAQQITHPAEPDVNQDASDEPDLVAGDLTSDPRQEPLRFGDSDLEFLDAKVGDISGHPIYVSSFFEPIEDRLIAIGSQRSDLNQWRREAGTIINARLNGIIYDELLRAETIAALTPQQRVGLQSFLKDFRSNILSNNLGSAQLANRRYLEDEGITLDQALRQKELDTLVGLTLYQEINRRINISWRDIKQRYERDILKFQPPPTVVLQVIRVLEPEGEIVDSITSRLEGGEAFAEIAGSDINSFYRETQGKIERVLEDDFAETEFFQIAQLNEAVWGLELGQWTGPVSLGNANLWILYADKTQESKSLYDAQLQIQRELTQERQLIEREAYLRDLMERARVSSAEEILFRLIYIAEKQYGPME